MLADIIFLPETYAPVILTRKVSIFGLTSISSVLMCVTGAETKTGDGAMGITQSSYVFSFELVFGIDYILASDETNDFTLRGFLEINLLRPVKMM